MAARFDSRKHLGKPTPGAVVEAYTGGAHSTEGTRVAFMRMGWRIGGFVPIYRQTNILAPRLVVDGLVPLGATVAASMNSRSPMKGTSCHV